MGFPTAIVTTLSKWTSKKNPDSYFGNYFLQNLERYKACLALEAIVLATLELL